MPMVGFVHTSPRRGHVRVSARPRRSPSVAGDDAGVPCRSPPRVEEIIAVMRMAGDRGARLPATRIDRDHVASRTAHSGCSRPHRGRSPLTPRLTPGPARQGGRRREVGMDAWGWEQLELARPPARAPGRPAPMRPQPRYARTPLVARRGTPPSCGAPPRRQECGAGSRHTSSVTPTPSRWRGNASR
jgi:hypothetical protein